MKNILLILSICVFLGGCFLTKKEVETSEAIDFSNPIFTEKHLQDFLNKSEADTLLLYQLGCVGCIQKFSKTYILFVKDGFAKVAKLLPSGHMSRNVGIDNIFQFLAENMKEIEEESLLLPKALTFHYYYKKISFFEKNEKTLAIEYQIPNQYEKLISSNILQLMGLIDSEIIWLEIRPVPVGIN